MCVAMNCQFLAVLVVLLNISTRDCLTLPRKLSSINVQHAAFLNLRTNNVTNKQDLLISTFSGSPFARGTVEMVTNVGDHYNNFGQTQTIQLASGLAWPNEITGVPGKLSVIYSQMFTWSPLLSSHLN